MTHLSTGVIIFLEGLSVRHPKGARSIGIGHPRSGDRCTKTLPYPLDPLWVAEQILAFRRPARGRGIMRTIIHRSSALRASTDAYGAGILRMLHIFYLMVFHLRSVDIGSVGKTVTGVAPRQGCPLFSPDVEGRSPEDSGLRWGSSPATPLGCRTDCLTGKCDTLAGAYFFLGLLSRSLRHFVPRHAGYRTMIPPGLRPCGIDRR